MEHHKVPPNDSELLFEEIHLRDYINIVLRHLHLVVAVFLMVVTTAVIITFSTTPVYQSTSKAMIEEASGEKFEVSTDPGVNYFRNRQFFETQVEVLKSMPVLEEVALEMDLYNRPKKQPGLLGSLKQSLLGMVSPGSDGKAGDEEKAAYAKKEKVLKTLANSLSFSVVRDTSIVQISCEDTDPQLAANIANSVARVFAKYSLGLKIKEISNANLYLSSRLTEIKEQLVLSEAELKKFQEEKEAISLDRRIENLTEQQINAVNELNVIERSIAQKNSYFDTLQVQTKDVRERFAAGDVGNFSSLKRKYEEQKIQLSQLLRDFTPMHPTVVTLKKELAALEEQIEIQKKLLVAGQSSTMQGIESTLEQYKNAKRELEGLKAQKIAVAQVLQRTKDNLKALLKLKSQYSLLQREVESNQKLFEMILLKRKEVSLKEAMQISDVKIVEPARLSLTPVKPKKLLNLVLGCMVGLFAGIGLAFLLDYFDTTLKTKAEIHNLTNLPVLGILPEITEQKEEYSVIELIAQKAPMSPYTEAYRSLCTSIRYSKAQSPKVILVTSSVVGEGKTTTALNLAFVFAQTGEKVLLIDGDLRKPRHHNIFKTQRTPGLSDVEGTDYLALVKDSGTENLSILSCGTKIGNPAEFMHLQSRILIEQVKDKFDRVIVDSPPVNAVADSAIMSQSVDAVLLVASAGQITKGELLASLEELHTVGSPVIGTVVNNLSNDSSSYYYYSRSYYNSYTD